MSLPVYKFSCCCCNLDAEFYFDTHYQFDVDEVRSFAPHLWLAWCDHCDQPVIAAYPKTKESTASDRAERLEWIRVEKAKDGKRHLVFLKQKADKEAIVRWETELHQLDAEVAFFADNPNFPRCLKCGSQAVWLLTDLPRTGQSVKVGEHKRCGGDLIATWHGRISFARFDEARCDENGNVLSVNEVDRLEGELAHFECHWTIEPVVAEGKYTAFLIQVDTQGAEWLRDGATNEALERLVDVIENRIKRDDFEDALPTAAQWAAMGVRRTGDGGKGAARRIMLHNDKPLMQWNGPDREG